MREGKKVRLSLFSTFSCLLCKFSELLSLNFFFFSSEEKLRQRLFNGAEALSLKKKAPCSHSEVEASAMEIRGQQSTSLWAKYGLSPVFVNTVVSAHSPLHSLTYCPWLLLCYKHHSHVVGTEMVWLMKQKVFTAVSPFTEEILLILGQQKEMGVEQPPSEHRPKNSDCERKE